MPQNIKATLEFIVKLGIFATKDEFIKIQNLKQH